MGEARRRRDYKRKAAEILDQSLRHTTIGDFERRLLRAVLPITHEILNNEIDIHLTPGSQVPAHVTMPIYARFVDTMILAVSMEVDCVAAPGQSGEIFEELVARAMKNNRGAQKEVDLIMSNFPYQKDSSKPS
jgi:hypothetical protein